MRQCCVALLLILTAGPLFAAGTLTWKAVWEWSCPKRTDADLTRIAEQAQSLGFNALLMSPPRAKMAFMADQCHQRGLKLYLSTVFVGGDKAWSQVMTPAQEQAAAKPHGPTYQFGGEPLTADELLDSPLPCWSRPEVRAYFAQQVRESAALPVDGLAFDYIGYRNYHRCYCPVCEQALADYLKSHPGANAEQWAEQNLVDFTNEMAAAARQARPDIGLTIHVYPVFVPHQYYGYRLNLDYVGETVSWFFRPHWPLAKVQSRIAAVVGPQGSCFAAQHGAPFVAFDSREIRNYRAASRVGRELGLIKSGGASALQMAELGYLLDKPLIAQAVAQALGGTYRAPVK
jgi:hypothetical protein